MPDSKDEMMKAKATQYHPDMLYHYTSIESLALILENRTLRFMPLSTMDDPEENMTSDCADIGRHFYASSWTDLCTESIPMWTMYTKIDAGVRIGLPPVPFKLMQCPNRCSLPSPV